MSDNILLFIESMLSFAVQKAKQFLLPLTMVAVTIVILFFINHVTTHADAPSLLTGCLKLNTGIVYDIATTSAPLNPCRDGDMQVSLGSQHTVTRIITANLAGWFADSIPNIGGGVRLWDSQTTALSYTFAIPFDYAGGDLRIREWWYVSDNSGTAKLSRNTKKTTSSDGTVTSIENSVSADLTEGSTGDAVRVITISSANVNPGDFFLVQYLRDGANSSDTMGRLDLLGVAVEYTSNQ